MHLYSLRERIYAQAEQHSQDTFVERFSGAFELIETSRIQYMMRLPSQEDILNLLMMTPYFWTMSAQTRTQLAALHEWETQVDMFCNLLERRAASPAAIQQPDQ
jgi:23S rRNA (guanine745-N1)-methyltransferase